MRRAARVDDNHREIVKGLRAVGASVHDTSSAGQGFPDLAVGYRARTFLLEIKDSAKPPSKRRLTPAQQGFHDLWRGHAAVVTTLDEALVAIEATRRPPATP